MRLTLSLWTALLAFIASADELPGNATQVQTVFLFVTESLQVVLYENDQAGFLVLERYRDDGDDTLASDGIVQVLKIGKPRPDSWFTHFMDCRYASGQSSRGTLISEVRTSEHASTSTNFAPANAWLVDPSELTIAPEDPSKIRCRESLP
jgi:hypothetical protein